MITSYYKQQFENLAIVPTEENYISVQVRSQNGKSNNMTITEKQLTAILAILEGGVDE
jgi:hypothetical protein